MTCSRTLKHGACVKKKMSGLPATWELAAWRSETNESLDKPTDFQSVSSCCLTPIRISERKETYTCFPGSVCDGLTAFPKCPAAM